MSRKIQFHTFHLLFRLFSYLADKSGGWSMFVRPKLVMGTFIISLGVTSIDAQKTIKPVQSSKQWSVKKDSAIYIVDGDAVLCYESVDEPYLIVDQMPEFPGGKEALYKFIANKIIYPQDAIQNSISGNVICSFIVDKDGNIKNIEVVRKVYPSLDVEAVRIIKSFPKWTPGKQGGKAALVKYTMAIEFKLPTQ